MKKMTQIVRRAALACVVLAGVLSVTGCDDYGYGLGDYGFIPDFGYGGYGPIDEDVFQNAADAWSDYIRM